MKSPIKNGGNISSDELLKTAKELKNNGQYDKAIEYYKKVLEVDENNLEALFWIGYCLNELGECEEALKYWSRYLELNTNNAYDWFLKGVALYNLGKYEEAIKCSDKALKINPNNAIAWSFKGVILHEQGNYKEAIKCFDKILEINPNFKFAKEKLRELKKSLLKTAINYEDNKHYDKAAEYYKKVLEGDKANKEVLLRHIHCLCNLRDYMQALEYCRDYLKHNPDDVDVRGCMGVILVELGDYKEAKKHFDSVARVGVQNLTLSQSFIEKIKIYSELCGLFVVVEELYDSIENGDSNSDDILKKYGRVLHYYEKVMALCTSNDSLMEKISNIGNKIIEISNKIKPNIEIELAKTQFKYNIWDTLPLLIKNTGIGSAKEVSIDILSNNFEIKYPLPKITTLKQNHAEMLEIPIKLKNDTEKQRLKIEIKYHFNNEEYAKTFEYNISIEKANENIANYDETAPIITLEGYPKYLPKNSKILNYELKFDSKYLHDNGILAIFIEIDSNPHGSVVLLTPKGNNMFIEKNRGGISINPDDTQHINNITVIIHNKDSTFKFRISAFHKIKGELPIDTTKTIRPTEYSNTIQIKEELLKITKKDLKKILF